MAYNQFAQPGALPPPAGFVAPAVSADESAWAKPGAEQQQPAPPAYYPSSYPSQSASSGYVGPAGAPGSSYPSYPYGPGPGAGEPAVVPKSEGPADPYAVGYAGGYSGSGADGADGAAGDGVLSFSEASVRNGFVRKVYGILTLQLIVTGAIVSLFTFVPAMKELFKQNFAVFITILCVRVKCS